jgi:hypothetical protein
MERMQLNKQENSFTINNVAYKTENNTNFCFIKE